MSQDAVADEDCRGAHLTQLFAAPMQRLALYGLMLADIADATPPCHPDWGGVIAAAERMRGVLKGVERFQEVV
jgi:hypothetical protein